jgi:hypothetical protein
LDAYPNADFAGLYGYKDNNDPVCVRSRTGYVITVAGCPIYWSSKLQTKTATSTMEAEIIALGGCCRELLPIITLVDKIGVAIGIKKPDDNNSDSSTMHVTIHEDNLGALILATTSLPQFTPRSKHMPSKPSGFARRSLRRKSKSPPSRRVFNWETSLQRCLLRSPLNSFGTCSKDGDNHRSRGSVEYN